ncbi:MAG: type II secretion system protein [Verrucomicrobiales bacterium]
MRTGRVSSGRGFTLLELVLAIGIIGLLMGAIFKLASGTIQATDAVVDRQNEEITLDAFCTLLKRHFESLPGNAVMELVADEALTGLYTSEMTFQNTPTAFNWGGIAVSAQATRIAVEQEDGGLFRVVLHYYEERILDDEEGFAEDEVEPVASITLISGLGYVDWQVLDGRTMEWGYEWDLAGRLPLQVELRMAMGFSGEEIRRIFWLPPKQSPVARMRQVETSARQRMEDSGVEAPEADEPVEPGTPGGAGAGGRGGNRGGGGR